MAPPRKLHFNAGERYGRLTVLAETRLPNTPGRVRHGFTVGPLGALCRCDCGNEIAISANRLTSGNTRSCGCLRVEVASARLPAMSEANVTHGLSRRGAKALYDTWRGMMIRCYDPHHRHYPNYGGRGITVCERWHDVQAFTADITAQLGERPAGRTLDRIDNDGGYEPGNIRWATPLQQIQNRRKTKSRYTEEQVAQMRAQRAAGAVLREIAATHGVSIATAQRLTRGVDERNGVLRRPQRE